MDNTFYSYVFFLSAILSFLITIYVFINRHTIYYRILLTLFFSITIWSFFYALELQASNYAEIFLFLKFQYIGISIIPPLWFIFVSRYSGYDKWLSKRSSLLLFIIPAITIVSLFTNQHHFLFYKTTAIQPSDYGLFHSFEKGIFYLIHSYYSYTLVILAIIKLILMFINVPNDSKIKVGLLLLSSFIPFIFSFLYFLGFSNNSNIDFTPLGFLIMGIIVFFGVINSHLLNNQPFMLNSLFNSLPDAIISIDINGNIVSSNPRAIDLRKSGIITDIQLEKIIKDLSDETKTDKSYSLEIESGSKSFKVVKSEVLNNNNQKTGYIFHFSDITQEKKISDELRNSEEQYRFLFENAREGIFVIQHEKTVFFNPQILKLTGYNSKELLSKNIYDLINSDDISLLNDIFLNNRNGENEKGKKIVRIKNKNNKTCWVEFSWITIEWRNEKALLLFLNDITVKKQTEELKELLIKISATYINAPIEYFDEILNESLQEMATFVNADRSYLFEYDWRNQITKNTYEWCAEGIQPEINNLQDVPLDLLPEWVETHKKNLPMFVDNVELLDDNSGVKQLLLPQGVKSLITIPMMDDECIGFVGFDSVRQLHKYSEMEKELLHVFAQMVVNLKRRKDAAKLLEKQINIQLLINKISSELISANFENFDSKLMIVFELVAKFFKVDRSYLLRYSSDLKTETNTHEWCKPGIESQKSSLKNVQLDKFPWWKDQISQKRVVLIPDADLLPEEAHIEKLEFKRQQIKSLICLPIIKDNVLIGYFGLDSVKVKREWGGNQIAVIEIITNILGDALIRTETQTELIRAKDTAEAASLAKSIFLSNMSHEIRTPLNGVIGFTELLRNTTLNVTQTEYLNNAINSANTLLSVISDILDFSKIESGKLEIEIVKTDIIQLFENSSDIIKIHASQKGIELLLNISPEIPRYAYIDPIRTKQILVNLLSNAVKFTHVGEIELALSFRQIDTNNGVFGVCVRDTGVGIREEDREKLFKAFSQADTSTTRRYGGTGLGLIISNSLAAKMGSNIEFVSEYGKGTTFSFDLECEFERGKKNSSNYLTNIKCILVVDDNCNNRMILEHFFKFNDIKYWGAESGYEAIDIIQSGEAFDLIIVDYHMPDLDGISTIKIIKDVIDETHQNQPIIMLHSSSDELSLHERAKKLGVRYLLTKPVKQDELFYYLKSIDDQSDKTQDFYDEGFNIAESEMSDKALKILVVEDTHMNMLVIKNMLLSLLPNAIIFEAENGVEGIKQMRLHQPELILMDVQMPMLDGIEASKQIRKMINGSEVPIIALTAGVSKEEREMCYTAGMDDFLAKPVESKELCRVLNDYLKKSHSIKEKVYFEKEIEASSFEREKFLAKVGNDDISKTILLMARTEFPKYIDEVATAIISGNSTEVKLKAHKLKGSSLNMEFNVLAELALRIESNCNEFSSLKRLLVLLKTEWKEIDLLIT